MSSSKEGAASLSKKPSDSAFKQQRLKAWQPILTPGPVILGFIIVGVIFIPIGAIMIHFSNAVIEHSYRYDEQCQVGNVCAISIEIPATMKHPVYMYYRLTNYYQNHRRYVKSKNDDQLRGRVVTSYTSLQDCDPLKSVGDSHDSANFYLPCGLIAKSMFNDTFEMAINGQMTPLRKDGIAWKSDKGKKFKNPPENAPGVRVIQDFEDEDFIVWMRTAGLPDFKKLYRIIDQDVQGNITLTVHSNYPVSSFGGHKYIMLSTTSWLGGKNPFLGYAYVIVGAICIALGAGFGIKHKISPRKLGDTKYLDWNK